MPKVSISDAIQLFEFSNTAQGGNGQVGTWPAKIIAKLKDLVSTNELGFEAQRVASWRGSFLANRVGFDLSVNPTYIESLAPDEQLPALSLVLVHEATHAALDFTRLYDEMAARKVPIYYYRELTGPGVFNEAADIPGKGPGKRVTLPKGGFQDYGEQSDADKKEQLIDYVLSIDTYQGNSYINAQWIVDRLSLWGGLKNRWPETRGLYIKKLAADSFDHYYTVRILDVMESVERQADWDTMMGSAGSIRTIRTALEDLSTNRSHAARIEALRKKWKINLTDEPPRRGR